MVKKRYGINDAEFKKLRSMLQVYARKNICLAFSGGVDSAMLLDLAQQAVREFGTKVYVVTIHTAFQKQDDLQYAREAVYEAEADHTVININLFENPQVMENTKDRCYFCKKVMYSELLKFAQEHDCGYVLDGVNMDDLKEYRPGRRAAEELGIVSPYLECRIGKKLIRRWAREMKLGAVNKASTSCLATRVPYNTTLTAELLERIEMGEQYLNGFDVDNVRLRVHNNIARIEIEDAYMPRIWFERKKIAKELKRMGFSYVTLDMEGYRSGSMDIGV